ncbi:hypothetical protein HanXRQr2_Chr11g0493101 [Helianthus annuus]|uniref:Uncharacterized protein n=1 Tax=Helianthus annuus TaxID=4232 RepID=A0A9K3HPP9_HELAN|nr:hypothetical protein HanXRQr2_Chr11g0493101 [Helianthus annuus]KAJ0875341.1 hypothetical protein HanPSC8_Chr11g0475141 [Helianthus annuus]
MIPGKKKQKSESNVFKTMHLFEEKKLHVALKAISLGSKRCLEKFSLFFKLSYFLKVRTCIF